MYPGRWNKKGEPALYTSTEIGTAALELLSHLPKDVEPKGYALMKMKLDLTEVHISSYAIDSESELRFESSSRIVRWGNDPESPRFSVFRDFASAETHVQSADSPMPINDKELPKFGFAVPSALVPAYNVVLFPPLSAQNRGAMVRISVDSVEPFEFHPALFQRPVRM